MNRTLCSLLAVLLSGCGEGLTGAGAAVVEIRTLQATYAPFDMVVAEIHNRGPGPIFSDPCLVSIERRRTPADVWNYGAIRGCMLPAGRAQRRTVRIGPGERLADSLQIHTAHEYEGEWRFHFQLLDARGKALPLEQRVSNVFQVVE